MSAPPDQATVDAPPKRNGTTTSALLEKYAKQKERIKTKTGPPGGFDPTPLPDAPPGYTVKFTFYRAFHLPIADLHLHSSDPFIHATLLHAAPTRHKEDPVLTRRTRTLRRTTEPEWREEWIVANVPASGFALKCRLYDEDWPDHDDRLGNVTVRVPHVSEDWEGFGPEGKIFEVKKRSGSRRAYFVHGIRSVFCRNVPLTPRMQLGIEVLGKSDPPHAQVYTVGPTHWVKHYSPMIGWVTGVKVNKDADNDATSSIHSKKSRRTKKFEWVSPYCLLDLHMDADNLQLPSKRDTTRRACTAQALPPLCRVPPHDRPHVLLQRLTRPDSQCRPSQTASPNLQL